METFEVRSKSFTIKWVKAPDNTYIRWELKPLKRSINLGIYRYNSRDEISESSASAQSAGASSASAVYGSENTSASVISEPRDRASASNLSASWEAADPQADGAGDDKSAKAVKSAQLFSRENISVDAVNRVPRKLFSTIHKTFFSTAAGERGASKEVLAHSADADADAQVQAHVPEEAPAGAARERPFPSAHSTESSQRKPRHRSESRSSLISFNRVSSLEERIDRHLTQEKWVGSCAGDEFISRAFRVERGGLFAFVFDNTFSRTKAKKVMFTQWVEDGEEPARAAQAERMGCMVERRAGRSERSSERLHSHMHSHMHLHHHGHDHVEPPEPHPSDPDDTLQEEEPRAEGGGAEKQANEENLEDEEEEKSAHIRFKLPEEKQLGKNTIMIRLKGVQYLQGILRKKRRRAGGNFVRRFFNLNFKYAVLDYYADETSNNVRGNMLVTQAVISADVKQQMLYLDSGMEQWILKAVTKEDFDVWVQAFDYIKKKNRQQRLLQQPGGAMQPQASAEQSLMSIPVDGYGIGAIDDYIDANDKQRTSISYDLTKLQKLADTAASTLGDLKGEVEAHWAKKKMDKRERKERKERETEIVQDAANLITQIQSRVGNIRGRFTALADEDADAYVASILSGAKRPLTRTTTAATSVLSQDFFDAQDVMEEMNEGVVMVGAEAEAGAGADVDTSARAGAGVDSGADAGQPAAAHPVEIKYGSKENIFVSQLESEPESVSSSNECSDEDEAAAGEVVGVPAALAAPTAPDAQLGGVRDLYPLPYAGAVEYRKDIPPCAAPPPSLIGILRKSLGKDLTGITMPITSNEPISFMQKYAECFEYAALLNRAATDSAESGARMLDIACFAVSYLSSYRAKTRSQRKPFNPLLGETFEMVRPEMGLRMLCEKVVHHPVVFAARAEGAKWQVDHCFAPQQKFYGKAAEMFVDGKVYLKLVGGESGKNETYEWLQPTVAIKNVISLTGERYSEPTAQMTIHSSTGYRAVICFLPDKSHFSSRRSEKLTVKVYGPTSKSPLKTAAGTWTQSVRDDESGETVWEVGNLVPDPDDKFGFTEFAAGLNGMTEIDRGCAPFDSRRRPDQRMYEQGDVDKAEALKLDLEQRQRDRRSAPDGNPVTHKPAFFKKSGPGDLDYTFVEGPESYWERRRRQDWEGLVKLW